MRRYGKRFVGGLVAAAALGGSAVAPMAHAEHPDRALGSCPGPHAWDLQDVGFGDPYDKNEDGFICTMPVSNGPGNAVVQHGHMGHSHKDNNGPL